MLIGFNRNQDEKIINIFSDSNRVESKRNFGNYDFEKNNNQVWDSVRLAKIVPLNVVEKERRSFKRSGDYPLLPGHLKEILDQKMLFTSVGNSDYSALMYIGSGELPMGRTGVLLYHGEPVVVAIDGKEFIVEIKGIGMPTGKEVKEPMRRTTVFTSRNKKLGGLEVDEGVREYRNLELIRNQLYSFVSSDSVRGVALMTYKNEIPYDGGKCHDQAYLVRLSPSTIRASYRNSAIVNYDPSLVAQCLGCQLGKLMAMDLVHNAPHPENLVKVNRGFVLTDFADMRLISEIENPDIIDEIFECVNEIEGIEGKDIGIFYREFAYGLGIRWSENWIHANIETYREPWSDNFREVCEKEQYPFGENVYFLHRFYRKYLSWGINEKSL